MVLNILFPPQTLPACMSSSRGRSRLRAPPPELLIRLAVYVPIMIATYATGDMNLLIVPIMLAFICAEPDRGGRLQQLIDRGGGFIVGAVVAVAAWRSTTWCRSFRCWWRCSR